MLINIRGRSCTRRFIHAALLLACIAGTTASAGGSPTQTFIVEANSTSGWTIDGQINPALTLVRGGSYVFALQGVNGIHPFFLKTTNSTGSANAYNTGVANNGSTGTINVTINVAAGAPASLHYNCFNHAAMNGPIAVLDDEIFSAGFE